MIKGLIDTQKTDDELWSRIWEGKKLGSKYDDFFLKKIVLLEQKDSLVEMPHLLLLYCLRNDPRILKRLGGYTELITTFDERCEKVKGLLDHSLMIVTAIQAKNKAKEAFEIFKARGYKDGEARKDLVAFFEAKV